MVKNFAKGEIIVHEGDISTCAFLIDGGGVEVLKTLPNGKYRRVAVLKATEIFGEMGLIDDLPRSATVRALDEGCTVSILTKENYQVLLEGNNDVLFKIIQVLSDRLRRTLRLVADLERERGRGAAQVA